MFDRSKQYDGFTEEDEAKKPQRNFFIRTYNNSGETYMLLSTEYQSQIKHFHLIEHNQDDIKGRHSHIVLVTISPTTVSAVHKWFRNLTDDSGRYGNTFVEIPVNIEASYQYLVHANNPEKEHYDTVQIRHFGSPTPCLNAIKRVPGFDPVIMAWEDYKKGVSTDVLIAKYGRDYLYHITQFERAIQSGERDKNHSAVIASYENQLSLICRNFEDLARKIWLYTDFNNPKDPKGTLEIICQLQYTCRFFDSEELESYDFEQVKKQLRKDTL